MYSGGWERDKTCSHLLHCGQQREQQEGEPGGFPRASTLQYTQKINTWNVALMPQPCGPTLETSSSLTACKFPLRRIMPLSLSTGEWPWTASYLPDGLNEAVSSASSVTPGLNWSKDLKVVTIKWQKMYIPVLKMAFSLGKLQPVPFTAMTHTL